MRTMDLRGFSRSQHRRYKLIPLACDGGAWFAALSLTVAGRAATELDNGWDGLVFPVVVATMSHVLFGRVLGLYRRRWAIASFNESSSTGVAWLLGSLAGLATAVIIGASSSTTPDLGALTLVSWIALLVIAATRVVWRRFWRTPRTGNIADSALASELEVIVSISDRLATEEANTESARPLTIVSEPGSAVADEPAQVPPLYLGGDSRQDRFRVPLTVVAIGDVVMLNLGLVLGFVLHFGTSIPATNFNAFLRVAPFISAAFVSLLYGFDIYSDRRMSTRQALKSFIRPIALTALFGVTIAFFARQFSFPRLVLIVGFVLAGLLVILWRGLAYHVENRLRGREKVLVVVNSDIDSSEDQRTSLRRIITMSSNHVEVEAMVDYRNTAEILAIGHDVDLVIVTAAVPNTHRAAVIGDLLAIGVPLFMVPSPLEVALASSAQSYFHSLDGILINNAGVPPLTAFLKRVSDLVVSASALVVLSPLAVVAALAIRLEGPGSIIYRQVRVGRNEETFTLYKFRSMRQDAEAATGAVLATANDPRITRVGAFLRKSRLDELPQLYNVLLGQMSIVGPRPERPEFVDEFNNNVESYGRRFLVRPGITGLAQVRGGYSATVEEKLRFDLLYVNMLSLRVDLRIAIQTLVTMIDFTSAEGVSDAAPEATLDQAAIGERAFRLSTDLDLALPDPQGTAAGGATDADTPAGDGHHHDDEAADVDNVIDIRSSLSDHGGGGSLTAPSR